MRKFSFALAGVSILALTQFTFAADLPRKAPIAPAPVVPSWTGFYVGANLGYGWTGDRSTVISGNDPDAELFLTTARPSAQPPPLNSNGLIGGLQLGYNYQFAPSWLVGIETDFQGSDLNDSVSNTFQQGAISRLR